MVRAALTVAPLRIARGLQNKLLESMAMGVPVVTGARVAAGLGIAEAAGAPLRLAETAGEYVAQTLEIVDSPETRETLSAAGRRFVEADFSWSRAMERLDRIIAAVTGPDSGPAAGRTSSAAGPRA